MKETFKYDTYYVTKKLADEIIIIIRNDAVIRKCTINNHPLIDLYAFYKYIGPKNIFIEEESLRVSLEINIHEIKYSKITEYELSYEQRKNKKIVELKWKTEDLENMIKIQKNLLQDYQKHLVWKTPKEPLLFKIKHDNYYVDSVYEFTNPIKGFLVKYDAVFRNVADSSDLDIYLSDGINYYKLHGKYTINPPITNITINYSDKFYICFNCKNIKINWRASTKGHTFEMDIIISAYTE